MSDRLWTPLISHTNFEYEGTALSVEVFEYAPMGYLNLRGNCGLEQFRESVRSVLGVDLPVGPCTFNYCNQRAIYWLGPDEWLVTMPGGQEAGVESELRTKLSGHFSIADVSSGQTMINLSGKRVDMVLKKSSSYDFYDRTFYSGRCVQTTFAKTTALVSKKSDSTFDLVIRRSFADYLAKWIRDATREFCMPPGGDNGVLDRTEVLQF